MKKVKTTLIQKMERFAQITVSSLQSGKIVRAKRCLALAEQLFKNGNAEVKNAISNVYLSTVSCYLEINHHVIRQFLPAELHREYVKQINTSGV